MIKVTGDETLDRWITSLENIRDLAGQLVIAMLRDSQSVPKSAAFELQRLNTTLMAHDDLQRAVAAQRPDLQSKRKMDA